MSVEEAACPHCGCMDLGVLTRREWFGRLQARVECRYCGREFLVTGAAAEQLLRPPPPPAPPPPAPPLPPRGPRCSRCRGAARVTSTRRKQRLRYLRCRDCGHTWKEVLAD